MDKFTKQGQLEYLEGKRMSVTHGVLALKILVGLGGATFFALGMRFLLLGGGIAGTDRSPISSVADSHIRYLGVAGVGYALLMWTQIPSIATRSTTFYILIGVIFAGGLARLFTLLRRQLFDREVLFAAIPELILPPIVFLLQKAIASK